MAKTKVALFMIDGFEETEALCTVDILRRADIEVVTVSLGSGKRLVGRSKIAVEADVLWGDIQASSFDMLVIPGGTVAYLEHDGLLKLVKEYNDKGRKLAAICAAPSVFGKLGILKGRRALIYPGMESYIEGAIISDKIVETDGNVTTSKGPGTTVYFALRIVRELLGEETERDVAKGFLAQELK
ncbi:thiazole biosynthesis protein ThiJ [Synergistales bacterium]|nr:thiazole biosynthesis protein ThiJ [Synergistales bacterium]